MDFLLQKRLLILSFDIQRKFFLIYTKSSLIQKPLLAFQEYLCEKLDGCRYGTAESMTVWRIKDQEELDLNPGEEFYIIELKNSSHLFFTGVFFLYGSYQEIQETFGEDYFLPNFPLDDFLVEIMGESLGIVKWGDAPFQTSFATLHLCNYFTVGKHLLF